AGVLLVAVVLSPASAADVQGVASFLQKRCFDCHADGAKEGELDLKVLGTNLDDPAVFAKWVRIHDRVQSGEMPPRESDQPTRTERDGFVKLLSSQLVTAHAARKQTVLRRLNRRE